MACHIIFKYICLLNVCLLQANSSVDDGQFFHQLQQMQSSGDLTQANFADLLQSYLGNVEGKGMSKEGKGAANRRRQVQQVG